MRYRKLSTCACLWLSLCLPTAADGQIWSSKFDDTLDFSLHGQSGNIDLPGSSAASSAASSAGATEHAIDKADVDGRLTRAGTTLGAGLRGNLSVSGVRIGLALGAFRVTSPATAANPAPLHGKGFAGELFLAYAYGRDIRPYVELRGVWNALAVESGEGAGRTEDVGGTIHTLGLGMRAGLLIALDEYFFIDLGATRTLVGPDHNYVSLGLGIPIPLDNL